MISDDYLSIRPDIFKERQTIFIRLGRKNEKNESFPREKIFRTPINRFRQFPPVKETLCTVKS